MKEKEKVRERGKKMADVEDKRKEKKRRRFRPGIITLWENCKFQKYTGFYMRKISFARWVREIAKEQWGNQRFQALALLTLQKVAEV